MCTVGSAMIVCVNGIRWRACVIYCCQTPQPADLVMMTLIYHWTLSGNRPPVRLALLVLCATLVYHSFCLLVYCQAENQQGLGFWILLCSRQDPQTGASHRQAGVCEQLAHGCYLIVQWLGVEPLTSDTLSTKLSSHTIIYLLTYYYSTWCLWQTELADS